MEGRQIVRIMSADPVMRRVFGGLGASDFLPRQIHYPSAYILNTDRQSGPGIHWVSVYFDENGNAEFFDSFGFHPAMYGFLDFLKTQSRDFSYNNMQIQSSNSVTCGYFCIFFLYHRCRGVSMSKIISWFDPSCKKWNDHAVFEFVYEHFGCLM